MLAHPLHLADRIFCITSSGLQYGQIAGGDRIGRVRTQCGLILPHGSLTITLDNAAR